MAVLTDGKYVLQINDDHNGEIFALLSNEINTVLVQEVLFEKYWNEINTLSK